MNKWFKRWFEKPQMQSCEEVERLLCDRSTAEIAARLLRRAELHAACDQAYLKRCSALDKVAAENIRKLEGQNNKCMSEWLDRRDLCLRLLREGHK